jgi:amino acid permease
LGLPFAFQQAGLFMGITLVLLFCPLITFTLRIMGRAQKLANEGSYQGTVEKLLGHKDKLTIIALQLMYIMAGRVLRLSDHYLAFSPLSPSGLVRLHLSPTDP